MVGMVRRVLGSRVRRLALILFMLGQLVPLALGGPSSRAQEAQSTLETLPGRYIVMLGGNSTQSVSQVAAAVGQRRGARVDQVYQSVFPGFAGSFSPEAVRELMLDPRVAAVFPDYVARAQGQSLEPGINRVDADLNSTKSGDGNGSVDVDVAIIDSGVGPNADLNIAGGYDCRGQGITRDYYGHGTHVAGIVGAKDNDFGVVGVAPGARIWSIRVLDANGNGGWSYIICGMEWVASHADTIEVVNMSLGGTTWENGSGCDSSPTHLAICGMTRRGVTVMAAACNDASDARICTPGKYPEVISVSAFADWDGKPGGLAGCRNTPDGFYGCDDRRASFSNFGPTVDIAAIGVGVYSTLFDNRYGYWSGTSMATPHVTGGAALLIAQYGPMSPTQVKERLLRSAMSGPVPGDFDGYPEPILNVASLGPGTMTAPKSARPGDRVAVEAGELIPNTRATVHLNGVQVGSTTVQADGAIRKVIRMPELPYGKYELRVTNHQKVLQQRILVRPSITLSHRSGYVGNSVAIVLKGYGAGESVLVTFDSGAGVRSVVRVRASSTGVASTSFIVSPSTRGSHRVAATDDSGHATSVTFETRPSLVAESPVAAGAYSSVTLRGFMAGETVDLRWGSSTGGVLRTKVVTASGSGATTVLIPATSTDGKHSLWAVGDQGTAARVTVSTFAVASEPSPSPSSSSTATAAPSETPAEQASPTETATPAEPTSTPTETPSQTATAAPTETPTATIVDP
jgi:subtilisin family serine protease